MPRKRSPSQKEPTCKTKAHIILYLANKKEASFREIREHLIESLNIRNTKGIKTHLIELEKMGLIAKTPFKRGIKDSFYLDEKFESLKNVFNYLQNCEYELKIPIYDFMKTSYYNQRMDDPEILSKIMINLNKQTFVKFMSLMLSDNVKELINENIPDSEDKRELMQRLDAKSKFEYSTQMENLVKIINDKTVDELWVHAKRVVENLEATFRGEHRTVSINDLAIMVFSVNVFQGEDKEQIKNILRLSPSAVNFVLNSTSSSLVYLTLTLGNNSISISEFFTLSLEREIGKSKNSNMELPELKYPYSMIEPLILVIKSMVIYDMINGKLSSSKIPADLNQYVFSRPLQEASK